MYLAVATVADDRRQHGESEGRRREDRAKPARTKQAFTTWELWWRAARASAR